jgi:hypothetical protein
MQRSAFLIIFLIAFAATPALADFCDAGYFGPGGMDPCAPCQAGTVSSAPGSEVCSTCPTGTYQPNEGGVQCLLCPAGNFQPNIGSAECLTCPDGYIAPGPGYAQCEPCLEGFTSNESNTECVEEAVQNEASTWGVIKARYR